MKRRFLKLISVMLASIFVFAAMLPAVTAFAAFVNETVAADDEAEPATPGDAAQTPTDAEEEGEDNAPNLSPFKQFIINILEQLLLLTAGGKGAGGSSSFFARAINAIIAWLKK